MPKSYGSATAMPVPTASARRALWRLGEARSWPRGRARANQRSWFHPELTGQLLKLFARVEQARSNRLDLRARELSDLLVAEPFDLVEHEGFAFLSRELLQRRADFCERFPR